jgi:hypothetical protein
MRKHFAQERDSAVRLDTPEKRKLKRGDAFGFFA